MTHFLYSIELISVYAEMDVGVFLITTQVYFMISLMFGFIKEADVKRFKIASVLMVKCLSDRHKGSKSCR